VAVNADALDKNVIDLVSVVLADQLHSILRGEALPGPLPRVGLP
jgi:hypothetical protein